MQMELKIVKAVLENSRTAFTLSFEFLHVQHRNNMSRAGFGAFAAADALVRVHNGTEADDLHGVIFARFHALAAADTADLAHLHGLRALVAVCTAHNGLLLQRHKTDEVLRAGRHALGAALALIVVDRRNTVAHVHRTVRAHSGTVAHAHAAELAA